MIDNTVLNEHVQYVVLSIALLFVAIAVVFPLLGLDFWGTFQVSQSNGVSTFLKSQGANILTLAIMFITVLILFKMLGIDFNPNVDRHIAKVVTVESMETMPKGIYRISGDHISNCATIDDATIDDATIDDAAYYKAKLHDEQ